MPCAACLQALKLEAEQLSSSVLRLKLSDGGRQRWEVPLWLLKSELLPGSPGGGRASKSGDGHGRRAGDEHPRQLQLSVKQDPFSLEVSRPGEGAAGTGGVAALLNTTGTRLVYKASQERCLLKVQPRQLQFCISALASTCADGPTAAPLLPR